MAHGGGRPPESADVRLPVALGAFVGPSAQVEKIVELINSFRVVTLKGAAGVGKSRLALEAAELVDSSSPRAVRWLELSAATVPDWLLNGRHLFLSGSDSLRAGVNARMPAQQLVVLDNCDRLTGPCADLIASSLQDDRGLRFLCTSREPLGLVGEHTYVVQPLALPGADTPPPTAPAVQLFLDRAGDVVADRLSSEALETVAEICRRVDGLPLTIELAAARMAVLTPAQVLWLLDQPSTLLRGAIRPMCPRHTSMDAALEWSHQLLSIPEMVTLRRLAVFPGSFTFGAIGHLFADDKSESDDMLDALAGLVAKSLVVADTTGQIAHYRLLRLVRHFAASKLREAGEARWVRDVHGAWLVRGAERSFLSFDTSSAIGLGQHDPAEEYGPALQWMLADGQGETAMRLAGSLAFFWWRRGEIHEGRKWLERTLSVEADVAPAIRARALRGVGLLAFMAGDRDEGLAALEQSLALAREANDDLGTASSLGLQALLSTYGDNQPATALALINQSMPLLGGEADPHTLAELLSTQARANLVAGHTAAASRQYQECLGMARKVEDRHGACQALLGLGETTRRQGDRVAARLLFDEALQIARLSGQTFSSAVALCALGDMAWVEGDVDRALGFLDEALVLARTIGSPYPLGRCLLGLGRLDVMRCEPESALAWFVEAQALGESAQAFGMVSWAMAGQGHAAIALGDPAGARALLDQGLALARAHGSPLAGGYALSGLGRVARATGDHERSRALHHRALLTRADAAALGGVADSLESVAGLAACAGRPEAAVRLFAAAQTVRDVNGFARSGAHEREYQSDIDLARGDLDLGVVDAAWMRGSRMSVVDAVAYASRGRGVRQRPKSGWGSLTATERQVIDLAASGSTNRQIGERLLISPRTVGTHLSSVFAKLGLASRVELAIEVARQSTYVT